MQFYSETKSPPIFFRGLPLAFEKQNHAANNAHSPETTFEQVQPFMRWAGVTRLANITGLDRIGIPVYNAIRPNLRDFSVHHGKGLTPMAAKVSALMEAFERFSGARVRPPGFQLSYQEAAARYATIPTEKLALCKFSLFNENLPLQWTLGWDLVSQQEVAVPLAQVVLLDPTRPWDLDFLHGALKGFFQATSNGLAADTTFLGAIQHALLEVIERDAVRCAAAQAHRAGQRDPLQRVRLDTIPFATVQSLLEKICQADILPVLFDCTVDTQVPTYQCILLDLKDFHEGEAHGMGTSLDPEVAMTRAITEAVQARAVFKSGCRDTDFRDTYVLMHLLSREGRIARFSRSEGEVDASGLKNQGTTSLEGDIRLCLERLKILGMDQVIVFDLSSPDIDLAVVKVIVPGLEGCTTPEYVPGPRAADFMRGDRR